MSTIICEGESIFLLVMTGLSLRCSMKFSGLVHLVMLWDIKVEHEANYSAACSGDD